MYLKGAKSQKGKASKGSVQIKTSNGRLQLVFSYAGRRHYLSLRFADTPQTRKFAEKRAKEIELDILSGNFDSTLGKYKPQSSLSTDAPEETKEELQPTLDQLWEKFLEYKRPQCSPSTMRMQYRTFSGYLRDLPTLDLEQAVEIRDHVLQNVPLNSAKRFIVRLSACCD